MVVAVSFPCNVSGHIYGCKHFAPPAVLLGQDHAFSTLLLRAHGVLRARLLPIAVQGPGWSCGVMSQPHKMCWESR